MKVRELTLKVISFDALSDAIKEELGFLNMESGERVSVSYTECFLVHPPNTVEELELQPNWADICKQEDFKATDIILVQVPWPRKIKRKPIKNEQK